MAKINLDEVVKIWKKLPPDRSEPTFYTSKEMARFTGNKFIPNSIQMFMVSCGVLIGSLISMKIGSLSLEQIAVILTSVFGVFFSALLALSFTVRLGIDGKWHNFFISLAGVLGIITSFAFVYEATGLNASGAFREVGFRDAWYFSAVTWTTLGYGDFSPLPDVRIFAVIEALLGYLFTAIIIGVFVTRLSLTLNQVAKRMRKEKHDEGFQKLRNEMDRLRKEMDEYPTLEG